MSSVECRVVRVTVSWMGTRTDGRIAAAVGGMVSFLGCFSSRFPLWRLHDVDVNASCLSVTIRGSHGPSVGPTSAWIT